MHFYQTRCPFVSAHYITALIIWEKVNEARSRHSLGILTVHFSVSLLVLLFKHNNTITLSWLFRAAAASRKLWSTTYLLIVTDQKEASECILMRCQRRVHKETTTFNHVVCNNGYEILPSASWRLSKFFSGRTQCKLAFAYSKLLQKTAAVQCRDRPAPRQKMPMGCQAEDDHIVL